jgi:hypothetical protein
MIVRSAKRFNVLHKLRLPFLDYVQKICGNVVDPLHRLNIEACVDNLLPIGSHSWMALHKVYSVLSLHRCPLCQLFCSYMYRCLELTHLESEVTTPQAS